MIFDTAALLSIDLATEPFVWGKSDRLFAPGAAGALERSFPHDGFDLNVRDRGSDKTYRFAIRNVLDEDDIDGALDGLAPCWQLLLRQLNNQSYRDTLGRLTRIELGSARLETMFVTYGPGHWLSPHTDKYPKLLTQIFYFGGAWPADWGGRLVLLGDDRGDDVLGSVVPQTGMSVVLVRSDSSWHAVEPVRDAASRLRRSLQVNFWAADPPAPAPGRRVESGLPFS